MEREHVNKKNLVVGSAAAVVLLVIIGAIAGSSNKKHHAATTTNASTAATTNGSTATPSTTTSTPEPATTPPPITHASTKAAAAKPPKPKPKPKAYVRPASFHIDVTASAAGRHIRVGGTTNLPDGTVLTLNAERNFKQTHDAERVDFLGLNGPTQANARVHAGHFSGVLSAQEHDLAAIMQGDPGGPVVTIDPDADVCVILYTGRDEAVNGPWRQPPQARADLGTYGNFLRGSPGVGTFGSLTKHPSLDMLATTQVPLDPSALARGLAAQQPVTPQIATLPNICTA
jgi:hypothetical protein